MGLLHRRFAGLAGLFLSATVSLAACGSTGTEVTDASGATGSGGAGGLVNGGGGAGAGIHTTSAMPTTSSTGGGGVGGGVVGSGPPYPFVLAHGFFGFEKFAGLDFETYYFHVKEHLAAQGEIVDTPAVDPFNDSDYRGQQLLKHIEDFLAETGAAKVNIIGHSQGGLDARVVANLRPDLVASVVTISTPHYGSPVGDVAMKLLNDPNGQMIIDELTQLLGGALYDTVGNATSLTKALQLFSQPGITAFNQKHPDSPGVFYASIAGRSALHGMGDDCEADVVVPFISNWEDGYDPLNPLFYASGLLLAGTDNTIHDGLVRARDAKWGEYWGCLPADHVDEVGQILGQSPGIGNDWKYLDFYSELIAYMRSLGY
jgi:triacylglycerol lipase